MALTAWTTTTVLGFAFATVRMSSACLPGRASDGRLITFNIAHQHTEAATPPSREKEDVLRPFALPFVGQTNYHHGDIRLGRQLSRIQHRLVRIDFVRSAESLLKASTKRAMSGACPQSPQRNSQHEVKTRTTPSISAG